MTILPFDNLAHQRRCGAPRAAWALGAWALGTWVGYALLAAAACLSLTASAQTWERLPDIHNVYLLPMPAGLEQYLALRLTQDAVLQVVTDPQKADAVITDRIGADFEQRLNELYASRTADVDSGKAGGDYSQQHMRPLSRSHGAVFLVDRHTGNVLWSTSEQPKSSQAADLLRSAERIVERLDNAQRKALKERQAKK